MRLVFVSRETFQLFPQLAFHFAKEVKEVVWLTNIQEERKEHIFKQIPKEAYEKSYLQGSPNLVTSRIFRFNSPTHSTLHILGFLRRYKPDIIIYHYSDGFAGVLYGKKAVIGGLLALPLLVLSRIWCKKIVLWTSNLDPSPIMKIQSRILYPLLSLLVSRLFVNESSQSALFVELGFNKDKISIMPEPMLIRSEEYSNVPIRESNSTTLLSFGILERRKGIHLLLHAIPAIIRDYPDTKVIVAGPVFDDSYHDQLKKIIDEKGLDNVVEIIPKFLRNETLVALIKNAQIIVNLQEDAPAPSGTLGITAAFGKCTIVSDTSIFRKHISDGFNGKLVKREVEDIAKSLKDLLQNPELREMMGNNLNQTFSGSHNWNRIIPLMKSEFECLLSDDCGTGFKDHDICLKDLHRGERL